MNISAALSKRIEDAIGELNPESLGHVNYEGIRYRALPLLGTIGEVWLLRPDGTFWRADSDCGLALEPLPESLHVSALVAGSRRYPWLAELLPSRPVDVPDCGACRGSGRSGPAGKMFCPLCGGLGWATARRDP